MSTELSTLTEQSVKGFTLAVSAAMEAGQATADFVREGIRLNRTIKQLAKEGFEQVILRNPKTGEERVLRLRP